MKVLIALATDLATPKTESHAEKRGKRKFSLLGLIHPTRIAQGWLLHTR